MPTCKTVVVWITSCLKLMIRKDLNISSVHLVFMVFFSSEKSGSLLLQRIGIEGIKKHPWFRKSYEPVGHSEEEEVNLDDVHAVFDDIEVGIITFKILMQALNSAVECMLPSPMHCNMHHLIPLVLWWVLFFSFVLLSCGTVMFPDGLQTSFYCLLSFLTSLSTWWFLELQDHYVAEQLENSEGGPLVMNAFEMIALSQGLNLSALFDRRQVQ